ncbi:MAG: VOC family protein, partial [Actinomycetia bacterium]|nr:VOC family protein [Actinomycetes bacterium]
MDGASLGVRLPAKDLDRARTFYAERLGLEPIDERDGALLYSCGGQEFAVFVSAGAANGNHTQLGFIVANLDDVVAELRGRGVVFEEFDFGDFPVTDGIVEI